MLKLSCRDFQTAMIKYVKGAGEKCGQNAVEGFQQFWKLKQIIYTKIQKEKKPEQSIQDLRDTIKRLSGTSVLEFNSFQKTVRKPSTFSR